MQDHDLAALLPAVIEASWGRSPTLVEPLAGGMNSATARVLLGSSAYVAKWVPSGHLADLRTGLALARDLSLAGLPAGAPLPDQVGGHDGLAVAGSQRVQDTEQDGGEQRQDGERERQVGPAEETGEGLREPVDPSWSDLVDVHRRAACGARAGRAGAHVEAPVPDRGRGSDHRR